MKRLKFVEERILRHCRTVFKAPLPRSEVLQSPNCLQAIGE